MRLKIVIVAFVCLFHMSLLAQNHTISGYVRDLDTKEILVGAHVGDGSSGGRGNITNSYGFYSLTLPVGRKNLTVSYLGYENTVVDISSSRDTTVHVYLTSKATEISEVVVHQVRYGQRRLGIVDVPIATIQSAPALLGETDLMKSLQFIPGVQNTSEGKSDLSVRGGSPDQNLILLDGAPLYNPNHVFGFLSVFNTDALKNVTLYKSGFPARFGGRLSSVIDVTTNDGNKARFSGSATIGLPTIRVNLEGPILKDRTSFTFSARRSYLDLLMNAVSSNKHGDKTDMFFHDLNAKIHHKINDRTFLYLSIYNGNDKLDQKTSSIKNEVDNHTMSSEQWDWGNTIATAKLSRVMSPNLFFRGMFIYNRYHYKMATNDEYGYMDDSEDSQIVNRNFLFSSGIRDFSISGDFDYSPNPNHSAKFGGALTFHNYNPEVISLSTTGDEARSSRNSPQYTYSRELALYAENDWEISPEINFNAGLRFSLLNVNTKTYAAIDPRLSLRFLLSDKMTIQAGYTMMQQYVHLLSSNSIVMQTDLWVPVTERVKPMRSTQYSIGLSYELSKTISLAFEAYHKDMINIIEYKDGISYAGVSAGWEGKVEVGRGKSYGVEFSIEKRGGRLTGTASYTLAKSERKFDEINFGEWFPSKYDRRHTVNVSLSYNLSKQLDLTAGWTYHSGDRITLPLMSYVNPDVPDTGGSYIPNLMQLEHRNNFLLPDYHRLDIGFNYIFAQRNNRYCTLNVSVYNLYCRMNPYKVIIESEMYTDSSGERLFRHSLKQITLFPIIPALAFSYNF